jgi:hypothetical protein
MRVHENKLEGISVRKGKYGKLNGYRNKRKKFKNKKERINKENE